MSSPVRSTLVELQDEALRQHLFLVVHKVHEELKQALSQWTVTVKSLSDASFSLQCVRLSDQVNLQFAVSPNEDATWIMENAATGTVLWLACYKLIQFSEAECLTFCGRIASIIKSTKFLMPLPDIIDKDLKNNNHVAVLPFAEQVARGCAARLTGNPVVALREHGRKKALLCLSSPTAIAILLSCVDDCGIQTWLITSSMSRDAGATTSRYELTSAGVKRTEIERCIATMCAAFSSTHDTLNTNTNTNTSISTMK